MNDRATLLDRPSSIQVKIHYTTAQEIGLKVRYPMEIIETVTINYKVYDRSTMEELTLSPPLFNLRLTNLSCGSAYRIMVYASNPAGFSSTESLIVRTEGSGENISSMIYPMWSLFSAVFQWIEPVDSIDFSWFCHSQYEHLDCSSVSHSLVRDSGR